MGGGKPQYSEPESDFLPHDVHLLLLRHGYYHSHEVRAVPAHTCMRAQIARAAACMQKSIVTLRFDVVDNQHLL